MSVALQALIDDLDTTTNVDDFWARINIELEKYGVNSILYGAIATRSELALGTKTSSLTWKCNHTHEYFDEFGLDNLVDNCFTFEHSLHETSSFVWHDENMWKSAAPEQLQQAYAERDMGLYVGFTLPTTQISPDHYGAIGVSMEGFSPKEFEKMWPEKSAELIQILGLLDTGMRQEHLATHIGLAPREKETMEWLAAGLRPDQIAERMGIGYRTVDKHIVSSKKKLKARTRDQAIARALIFKVIDL